MKRYCYICGYETDEDIYECPQCLCEDVFVTSKDEEELMILFDDRELTNAMIKLKQDNIVEYKLKLQQLKNSKEQQKIIERKQENNIPHCPTCSSTNLKKISTTSKVMNTAMWGIFGTKRHKTYHCNNCGYEW